MGSISWDDFDFDYDYDHDGMKRMRRKPFDIRSFELDTCSCSLKIALEDGQFGDGMMDDDYRTFLRKLCDFSESWRSLQEEFNGDHDGNSEDDMDPQYKMFLEKLSENGKSYVLEVGQNNGTPIFIKYEAEDGSDKCNPQIHPLPRRKLRSDTKGEKIEATQVLGNVKSKYGMRNPKILGNFSGKGSNNTRVKGHTRSETLHPVSHGTKHCSSQKLSAEDNNISEPQRKYDTKDSTPDGSDGGCSPQICPPTRRKLRSDTKGEKIEATEVFRNVQGKNEVVNPKNLGNVSEKERRINSGERHLRSKTSNPVSHWTKHCLNQNLSPVDNNISDPQRKYDMKDSTQDGSGDEHIPQICPPTHRKLWSDKKGEKIEATKVLRNVKSKDRLENKKKIGNVMGKERRNSGVKQHSRIETLNPVSHETKQCLSQKLSLEDNNIAEPQCKFDAKDGTTDVCYESFLNGIQIEDDCVVYVSNSGKRVKYEEQDGSDNECNLQICRQTRRKLMNDTNGKKIEATQALRNFQSKDKLENPKKLGSVLEKEQMNSGVKKQFRSETLNPVSHGTKQCLSQKLSPEDNNISEPQRKCDTKDATTDVSYQAFLNGIQMEGDSVVFVTSSGKRVKYEEDDDECSSDTEILVMDNAPYCGEGNSTPFVTSRIYDASMEGDDCQCLGNPSKNDQSQFRVKVMSILEKPYDHREYENLWHEINARKPSKGHRDLRGGLKTFTKDRCSKSYLDHFSDLKSKIDEVQFERHKVLNILRGFFYWLKNLQHEGAFHPWLDTSCLAVMPRTHTRFRRTCSSQNVRVKKETIYF